MPTRLSQLALYRFLSCQKENAQLLLLKPPPTPPPLTFATPNPPLTSTTPCM